MLDTFNTIAPSTAQFFEFNYATTNNSARRNQAWSKPRGVSMLRFLLIGPGGGGANGFVRTGGGSGAVTSWLVPAMFVPDTLIISPGIGGAGGAGTQNIAQNGTNGGTTTVAITPSIVILQANGGGGGTASAGSAGTASTAFGLNNTGIYISIAGQAGAASLGAITPSATTFLTGGAGGGTGSGVAGASVTPLYGYPVVEGGPGTGSVDARNGRNGYFITQPIMFGCGGSGGGDGGSGTSGKGGDGGIGCGGGGAGEAGSTLITRAGGNGGNGAVFIWAW
jgi:hypothetical protein